MEKVDDGDALREQVATGNSLFQDLPFAVHDTAGPSIDAKTLSGKLDSPSPRRITSMIESGVSG